MATASARQTLGPADHGRRMTLDEFIGSNFQEGWLYELARGAVVVTEVPGIHHGKIVDRLTELFVVYKMAHPGIVYYQAAGSDCRVRLPGMQSDRHPDQAIYLSPPPPGERLWSRWVPDLVVEVVSAGGEDRDYVEKREEYLNAGVREYWIVDPARRLLVVLTRDGEAWSEAVVAPEATYRSVVLPGLEVRPDELLGPAADETPEP